MVKVLTSTTVIEDIFFSEGFSDTLVPETILLLTLRRMDLLLEGYSQGRPLFLRIGGKKVHFDSETQELVIPIGVSPEDLAQFLKKEEVRAV
jgi:hypothetical protein